MIKWKGNETSFKIKRGSDDTKYSVGEVRAHPTVFLFFLSNGKCSCGEKLLLEVAVDCILGMWCVKIVLWEEWLVHWS